MDPSRFPVGGWLDKSHGIYLYATAPFNYIFAKIIVKLGLLVDAELSTQNELKKCVTVIAGYNGRFFCLIVLISPELWCEHKST